MKASVNHFDVEDAPRPAKLRTAGRHMLAIVVLTALSLILNLGGTLGGIRAVGLTYSTTPDNVLDTKAVAGIVIFLVGISAGPLAISLAVILAARTGANFLVRAGVPVAGLAGCIAAVWSSAATMLQADITFRQTPAPDNLRQTLGGFVVVVYGGMAVALAIVLFLQLRTGAYPAAAASKQAPRAVQPTAVCYNWRGMAFLTVLFALCFWLTTFMSSCWNYSATSYFTTPGNVNSLTTATWTLPQYDHTAENSATVTWYAPIIYFKIYADVVVYFSVVFGVALLGFVGSAIPSVRRLLHRRLLARGLFAKWVWVEGVSVGEALVLAAVGALFAYWTYYWGSWYGRFATESGNMFDPNAGMQKAARVLGHFTTLTMSFLTFPVARNSVWEAAFGIPFERAIKYHRVLGRLAWAFVTLHMVIWQCKWAKEGTLWNNVVTINNLLIANTGDVDPDNAGDHLHDDNFTIPIAELGWLILTVSIVLANFSRRWNYELFHWVHHGVWFFFLAALIHAWSHWYYMIGGLALYFTDKLTRMINATRAVRVKSIAHAAGVTRLEIASRAAFAHTGGRHWPGQYAFVNLPGVALLEWHPFTLSAPPHARDAATGETVATFHIKDMGPGTWTHRLAQLALAHGRGGAPAAELPISVDGPYGRAGHYSERQTLILVAGGIGVTPLHSIVADLHARVRDPATFGPAGAVRKVHLVWAAREASTFLLFADTLAALLRENPAGGMFSLHLHLTEGRAPAAGAEGAVAGKRAPLLGDVEGAAAGSAAGYALGNDSSPVAAGMCSAEAAAAVSSIVARGRPKLDALFAQVAAEPSALHPADRVSVMVCGPTPMIAQSSALAAEHGFDFHSEVFHF